MTTGFKALLVAVLAIQIVHSYVLLSLQVEIHRLEAPSSEPMPWWAWTSWMDW